jgi:hypothetical protein
MAQALRKAAEVIRSAPPLNAAGAALQRRVARGLDLSARMQDEAEAMYRRRKPGEPIDDADLKLMRLCEESTWKAAGLLERVGSAALQAQSGGEDKIEAILKNVRALIKKGKPKQ